MICIPTETEIAALVSQMTPEQLRAVLEFINDLHQSEDVN